MTAMNNIFIYISNRKKYRFELSCSILSTSTGMNKVKVNQDLYKNRTIRLDEEKRKKEKLKSRKKKNVTN